MSVTTTLLSAAIKQTEAAFEAVIAIRFGLYENDADLTQISYELDDIRLRLEAKLESVTSTDVESREEQLELGE